ncbi:MAG: hypothetical protein IOD12_01565 [Silvanigrellales bacterium]|nr:hypothetical protein [Silvanigrellales bacterium]
MNVSSSACRALFLSVTAVAGALSSAAFAAEPAFRLSTTAARAGMLSTTLEPEVGPDVEETTSTLTTFPSLASFELAAYPEGYAVYLYPAVTGGSLWLGKAMSETMEVGVTLGLNNSKEKESKKESMTNTIGAYYWGSMPAGPGTFEANINPFIEISSGKETTTTGTGATAVTGEVKTSGTQFGAYADALFVMAWGKNFEYAAGADLLFKTGSTTSKLGAGAEAEADVSSTDLGLILGKFRMKF